MIWGHSQFDSKGIIPTSTCRFPAHLKHQEAIEGYWFLVEIFVGVAYPKIVDIANQLLEAFFKIQGQTEVKLVLAWKKQGKRSKIHHQIWIWCVIPRGKSRTQPKALKQLMLKLATSQEHLERRNKLDDDKNNALAARMVDLTFCFYALTFPSLMPNEFETSICSFDDMCLEIEVPIQIYFGENIRHAFSHFGFLMLHILLKLCSCILASGQS